MIKLGLFSDSHYCDEEVKVTTRFCSLSYKKLCDAYDEFEKQKVDLIICLGDLCDVDLSDNKFDSIKCLKEIVTKMKSSSIPFLFITGNHDSLCTDLNELQKIIGSPLAPATYETDQYRFICLDANFNSDMQHFSPAGFDWTDVNLPLNQIEFLKNALETSSKECIVLIHEPIDSKTKECYRVNNAPIIREILEKSGKVKLVIQGHKHYFDDYIENNIRYVTVNGMCEGKENRFMICDYDTKSLKIKIYDGNDIINK